LEELKANIFFKLIINFTDKQKFLEFTKNSEINNQIQGKNDGQMVIDIWQRLINGSNQIAWDLWSQVAAKTTKKDSQISRFSCPYAFKCLLATCWSSHEALRMGLGLWPELPLPKCALIFMYFCRNPSSKVVWISQLLQPP